MNAMSLSQWILAATLLVAAVALLVSLSRIVRRDGYGSGPAPDPRADWGTSSMPSAPFASHY